MPEGTERTVGAALGGVKGDAVREAISDYLLDHGSMEELERLGLMEIDRSQGRNFGYRLSELGWQTVGPLWFVAHGNLRWRIDEEMRSKTNDKATEDVLSILDDYMPGFALGCIREWAAYNSDKADRVIKKVAFGG